MPASPERQQPDETSKARRASGARGGVSSRQGGRVPAAPRLLETPPRSDTRGLGGAGLVGHHGGATMERALGERVNERALASECVGSFERTV